ncbi:hypothetical protein TTRE_0000726101 [Trichuris trichiura]|uniref:Uncharacterized protein n=1 Tax=Trichuris trichiura TaxID=36087 RepID=A0A077ZEV5_TRITR|nr:hypothetical protein TTRE_0000726101 [Trichuris trichiura]
MYSISEIGIFSWQTWIIRLLKDKAANEQRIPLLGVWKPEKENWKPGSFRHTDTLPYFCFLPLVWISGTYIWDPYEFEAFDLAVVSVHCGVNSLLSCLLRHVVVMGNWF